MNLVSRVSYCCSKEGYRQKDKQREVVTYSQPISRVGCRAHMTCLLQKNGKFRVVSFEEGHNHDLIATPMKHMLKINRSMSEAQKTHANDAEKVGLPIKATVDLMSIEVGGRDNLGFLDKDYRNYIHSKRKTKMKKGDVGAILPYFQKMHSENSSYFYVMQVDDDDMITNIFWADARSVSDYNLFGDVVCFDTTYRTNEYGRPFAPFVGVNHHKQTVVFGVALLYDETTASFRWLFNTFLSAMSGKQPKTILTDQSAAMSRAIFEVFPETCHRLYVWHIYQNAAKNLSHVFHRSTEFAHDFSTCVYDYEDENEWLLAWNNMLEKYSLQDNNWLRDIFNLREKWALVYGRHTFTADMKSTQRSESMNNVLKKYLKPKHDCLRFFEHYERVLADRRYQELLADFKMMETSPILLANVEMLQQAVEVYTPEVFKLFQKECTCFLGCSIHKVDKSETITKYRVFCASKRQEHLVKFEASTQIADCSCMKFSFVGILCGHAIKVLDKKNVKKRPSHYILNRWTRTAKARSMKDYHGVGAHDNPKESMGKRYSHLCRNFREIASLAVEHDKLTEYAHHRSIEMLKGLEEIKKSLGEKDCTSGVQNLKGKVNSTGKEHVEIMVEPNNCETTIVCGVKRKATVRRPRGRLKDPLEQKKSKSTSKSKKTPARRQIAMEEFTCTGESSQTLQGVGHEAHLFDSLPQGYVNVGTGSEQHFQATKGIQCTNDIPKGTKFSFLTSESLDEITCWQQNVSFTQLLNESTANFHAFSQDERAKQNGN